MKKDERGKQSGKKNEVLRNREVEVDEREKK